MLCPENQSAADGSLSPGSNVTLGLIAAVAGFSIGSVSITVLAFGLASAHLARWVMNRKHVSTAIAGDHSTAGVRLDAASHRST
jgi:hypothetical protein